MSPLAAKIVSSARMARACERDGYLMLRDAYRWQALVYVRRMWRRGP
jgi:hypothetical protein